MSFLDSSRRQVFLNKMALAVRYILRKRTSQGMDVDGKPFVPYSEKYAKKRAKKGLPITPPDLIFDETSGMMHRIDHEVFNDNKSVEVFINTPEKEQLAIYHNIDGAGESKVLRRFWGLMEGEKQQLFDLAEDEIVPLAMEAVDENIVNILKKLEADSAKTVFRDN